MVNEANASYLPFDLYPYEFDIAKIVDVANRGKIGCIFIASPNNPTGHAFTLAAMRHLLDGVSCTVILDESLLLSVDSESKASLIDEYPNIFICGSFSKLYGMAGLRIGYLVANHMHTKQLQQLISPFAVDGLALAIANHVSMQHAWLRKRTTTINNGIAALRSIDSSLLRVTHTQAPVALLDYRGGNGSLYQMLCDAGILTVACQEFPGLAGINAVRVIINGIQDVLRLKGIMANIL
jgi:histidinol-phosphate aminotransferase